MCLPLLFCAFFFGCLGLLRIARFLLAASPRSSCPPRLVLWVFLVQSVSAVLSSGFLVVSCDGPVVMPGGMQCHDGKGPVFTCPDGNKGFGPVWGSALYTMLRVLFRCFYLPSGDPEPLWTPLELHAPTSSARAAFFPLLRSPAPSPSCCCWPPLAFSLVPVHTKAIMAQLSLYLVCFSCVLLGLFGVFWSLFLFCCCACWQPTEDQGLQSAAGPISTHTPATVTSPPLAYLFGLSLNSFVFPSNAFMAFARSLNMFYCMLQIAVN